MGLQRRVGDRLLNATGRRVKHLNPRQGITILSLAQLFYRHNPCSVKHLNPRQGITRF